MSKGKAAQIGIRQDDVPVLRMRCLHVLRDCNDATDDKIFEEADVDMHE